MNIAVLFNSDHSKYNYMYGQKIQESILSTKVLQEGNRQLKVSIGDVLIPFNTDDSLIKSKLYYWHPWHRIHDEKLKQTYLKATVYAWVIQNITHEIAEKLHKQLSIDEAYLGIHQVDFSHSIHLALYRNSMIPLYRIEGYNCNKFYSMSDTEELNDSDLLELEKYGFKSIGWEDNGARQTIFDDFDTIEHFQKVNDFEKTISPYIDEYSASELVMLIEDLSPKLFNALGAAIRVLANASNEEEFAQVSLSARRYIEQLADILFPPQDVLVNGKRVTKAEYKNRIWAFISEAIDQNEENRLEKIKALGDEVDRLVIEVNAVLHSEQSKERMFNSFIDLAKLSILLLNLPSSKTKNPYHAFDSNLTKFINELNNRPK